MVWTAWRLAGLNVSKAYRPTCIIAGSSVLIVHTLNIGDLMNDQQKCNVVPEFPKTQRMTNMTSLFGSLKDTRHQVVFCGEDEDSTSSIDFNCEEVESVNGEEENLKC